MASFKFMALLLFSLVLAFGVSGTVNGSVTKLDPSSVLKTIVLKPSSYPTGSNSKISTKLTQMWHRDGEYCPEETVPIVRSSAADSPPKNTYDRLTTLSDDDNTTGIPRPEFATAVADGFDYYGINAEINIWNPRVEANESSSSQVWVTSSNGEIIESIQTGYMVDGFGGSGCYNLDCPGFVLISPYYSLGSQVQPTSTYGGNQYSLTFKIYKDFKSGNWWLNIQGTQVGYWPVELFTNLKTSAQLLEWGGRVINTNANGNHTTTQMGSGSLPGEGWGKAAFIHHLEFADENGVFTSVDNFTGQATRPECYDVLVQDWIKDFGSNFLYGGNGYSPACL
ncbi:hypothetical protein LINGRAHAP2_LOCUS12288 [Linum grandiflorum]